MEDLTNSLDTYKVQLTQVQAALTLDPQNEELLKLQVDLKEVVQLTLDLISNEAGDTSTSTPSSSETTTHHETSHPSSAPQTSKSNDLGKPEEGSQPIKAWKTGDSCLAFKESEGCYKQAVVEDILPESETVAVTFVETKTTGVCQLSHLKLDASVSSTDSKAQSSGNNKNTMSKKELLTKQQEYRKKRNLKKKMRLKEKEAESEIKKNNWKNFNSKSKKGIVKKSIFASPEGVGGKVGIGTCGVADKKMTKYDHGAKYNARHLIPR